MANKNGKSRKKPIEYSSLKTGNCGIIPIAASEICAEKRKRNDNECKGCWMSKK